MATSDFENAQDLLGISGDGGDPTADGYDENIAGGNNAGGTTGIQVGSMPTQTSLPTPSPIPGTESNDKPGLVAAGTPSTPGVWDPAIAGAYDVQLSANYKVRDFSIKALYPNQITDINPSCTPSIRYTNLKGLAANVAEAVRAKFGPFRINSAIRNENSTAKGLSQHVTGQAMDIQFPGWNYQQYWDAAAWVKDNITYDQFIYEHSDATGSVWFHLSYSNTGNRPSGPTKVMTMYRNHYDPGLQRHG